MNAPKWRSDKASKDIPTLACFFPPSVEESERVRENGRRFLARGATHSLARYTTLDCASFYAQKVVRHKTSQGDLQTTNAG